MLKFTIKEDENRKNLLSEGTTTVRRLNKEDYIKQQQDKWRGEQRISKNITLINNNNYSSIRLSTSGDSYYEEFYSKMEELENDIQTIKELANTNLAKNVLGLNNNEITDGTFTEIDNIEQYPHKSFKSLINDTYIYKVLAEDGNQLIIRYINKKKKNNGRYQSDSYLIKFSDRDKDIMEGIFSRKLSFVMANAIMVGRELKSSGKKLYRFFQIPKKDGSKMRDIYEPCPELKESMKNLNKVLQKAFDSKPDSNQYAYIKGKNIKDNARVHQNAKTIVKTDITSFFESTKYEFVKPYLRFLCRDENLLEEFGSYIINPKTKGLYMGNPISGTLTNLMMNKVVVYLQNILNKRKMNISVYADDITISTNEKISKEMVVNVVTFAMEQYNLDFQLKMEKTKKLKNQNRHICGVTINHNDVLTVRREYYEKTRVMLYKLSRGEEINIPMTTFKGRLNFYKYIDETGKFDRLFKKYEDTLDKIGFKI